MTTTPATEGSPLPGRSALPLWPPLVLLRGYLICAMPEVGREGVTHAQ